ncbi:MAG: lysophospholipid acyltransferase family protein [Gammaproteobacteria bacterium]|nr:lysophospholipid acyltransferase family protein [Gammaproteobacteria bacterium]
MKFSNYIGFALFWLLVQLCRLLPFPLLYGLSYLFYLLTYYVIPLRQRVVMQNLRNAFPSYSAEELRRISREHVRFVCDMALETLKGFTLSPQELSRRWRVTNPELLDHYQQQGLSLIAIGAHYANWEWGVSLNSQSQLKAAYIYKALHNPLVDRYLQRFRTSHQAEIIPVSKAARCFLANRNKPRCYILIADQHPGGANTLQWFNFLNQDTAFIVGPEKYAKSFNYPAAFFRVDRIKRGYYQATVVPITDTPQATPEGFITEQSMRILEQQIQEQPVYWLWGHKRWKLKR